MPPAATAAAPERIREFDGLRGVAIALVLLSHLSGSLGFYREMRDAAGPVGHFGVRIFFIMTGYLVTLHLLSELEKRGRIDFGRFWMRRAVRLLPPVLLYLSAVYVAAAIGVVKLRFPADVIFPLSFTMNYYPSRGWYWVHLWSLSAQVQFYLLWPVLVSVAGRGRMLGLALGALCAAPVIRVAAALWLPRWYTQGHSLETIIDMFAVGALLAVLRERLGQSEAYLRFVRSPGIIGVVLMVLLCQFTLTSFKAGLIAATPLNIGIGILIDCVTRFQGGWWNRLLTWRPLLLLGTISYSLYIWQQPFINVGTPLRFPVSLLGALAAGTAAYFLVERPVAAWARRTYSSSMITASTSRYEPAGESGAAATRST